MARAFPITYTGENSAVKLPDLDKLIRSQERTGEMTIAGQEKLLQRKEKDSAFVLEQMRANPVLLISDKLRKEQAVMIDNYSTFAGKLLAENDGILPLNAKLAVQKEHDALVAAQQTMQADQTRFQQEYALMQKDQGSFYDEQEFKKGMEAFYETGQYPPTALIAKPKDAFALLGALKPVSETRVPQEGDTGYDITSKMTLDQAKMAVRNTMLRDEGSVRGFLKVFESLPEAEQLAVLDTNNNNTIDPTEKQVVNSAMDVNNPIVQWAESYEPFIQQAMGMKTVPRTATQEKGKTPTKPFKTTIPVGGGNNRNLDFSESSAGEIKGNWTFDSWVDIKKSTTGSISINEWYSPDDTTTKKKGDNNVVLDIIGYSPSQDKIVARVKSADVESSLFEDDVVILDGDRYDSLLRRELKIHRQGFKSFKQAAATKTGQGSFQGSYVEYKKKYPNGTPEEYRELTGAK